MKKLMLLVALFISLTFSASASYIILPMDNTQSDHLKAYGMTYWVLEKGGKADWLLNYKGGSFAFKYLKTCLLYTSPSPRDA